MKSNQINKPGGWGKKMQIEHSFTKKYILSNSSVPDALEFVPVTSTIINRQKIKYYHKINIQSFELYSIKCNETFHVHLLFSPASLASLVLRRVSSSDITIIIYLEKNGMCP